MKLFNKKSTTDYFESKTNELKKEVSNISDGEIMTCNIEEWVNYLYSKYEIQPIVLLESNKTESIEREKIKKYNMFYRYNSYEPEYFLVDGVKIKYKIPFDGDGQLLHLKPSTFILTTFDVDKIINPNQSECGYIELSLNFTDQELSSKGEQMRKFVDITYESKFQSYREMIKYINSEINNYNNRLKSVIKQQLDKVKQKATSFDFISKSLEIPLTKSDMSPNSVPIPLQKIKRTPISKPRKAPIPNEYSISDSDYENIINIIYMDASTMEKTARSYYKNTEEELRDRLLASLNTHYYSATGETFRKIGKTDINIEFDNNAAFISECKIWHGEKKFADAIKQLFNYSTWRDVKLSVIVFNKYNQDFQSIITKIEKWITENTKSFNRIKHNVWNCIYHRKDMNIDVKLNISVFDLYVDKEQFKD